MKQFSLHSIVQLVRWHRRGIGVLALAVAAMAALGAVMAGQNQGTPVVVAGRDLAPGATLVVSDLRTEYLAPDLVPGGAFASVAELVGRALSVGLTRGTPITTAALGGDSLVDHTTSEVLVPLRVRDAAVAALLHVGDRLTIVVATPEGQVRTLARHVRVAQLPSSAAGGLLGGGSSSGALVVVAVPGETAGDLAGIGDQWSGVIIE